MKPCETSKQFQTCLEWAQEGERLCKSNNIKNGIEHLEKALKIGTDDMRTLSAIYSQLGNAFFSLRDYERSVDYHCYDMLIARLLKDIAGEAKACGNIGNAFKFQGSFNDAITFTKRQLDLARSLNDKACEARALYNLASAYLMKGKKTGRMLKAAGGDISLVSLNSEVSQPFLDDLREALNNYKASLDISENIGDRVSCGRTYGCLGNTHYLLREFSQAVEYHRKRLEVAREFGDKAAQRRAYSNLGNAHVFLSELEQAIEYYRLAHSLAVDLKDKFAEAQSCFSLANAAALLCDYETAAKYHAVHLSLARLLKDRAGEARAYTSLASDYRNFGDLPKSAYFLVRHRQIAKEMNDNILLEQVQDSLRELLAIDKTSLSKDDKEMLLDSTADPDENPAHLRISLSLHSLLDEEDCGITRQPIYHSDGDLSNSSSQAKSRGIEAQEDLFELLSKIQSRRMDEQRCDASILSDMTNTKPPRHTDVLNLSPTASRGSDSSRRHSLFGRVKSSVSFSSTPFMSQCKKVVAKPRNYLRSTSFARLGSYRSKGSSTTCSLADIDNSPFEDNIEESQFAVPRLPPKKTESRRHSLCEKSIPKKDDNNGPEALIDLLMQVQGSGRRMDEQRATLLPGLSQGGQEILDKLQHAPEKEKANIDDQLLELLVRAQSQRMNEQRSELGGRPKREDSEVDIKRPPTIPDGEDEICALVLRMQASGRLEEQRSSLLEQ
ncbi:unnamed protein product [Auanema sp. JU1783]|nr:unnamed protein product [Auanema sp. JU1783]